MPAYRDKTQKFTFLYANLYQIYRTHGENEDHNHLGVSLDLNSQVLRVRQGHQSKVKHYQPPQFDQSQQKNERYQLKTGSKAMNHLKQNVQKVSEINERLKFMLTELDDLVKSDQSSDSNES